MQYLNDLPKVSSISTEGDIIELELEEPLEKLPECGDNEPVILVAKGGNEITTVVGQLIELENIKGPHIWCQLKIKGSYVSFGCNY